LSQELPGISVGPSIPAGLSLGNLKGAVDGVKLAKELFSTIYNIVKLKLPIHIYLDAGVVGIITEIFDAMGVKYTLLPVEKLKPPYILIRQENDIIDVLTVDEGGKPVTIVAAKLDSFLGTFLELFKEKYPGKSKKVLELLREESAGKEKEEKVVEIGGGEISAIEETLRGFESE